MNKRPCFEVLDDLKYQITCGIFGPERQQNTHFSFWLYHELSHLLSLCMSQLSQLQRWGKSFSGKAGLPLCSWQTETQDYTYLQFWLQSTVTSCCIKNIYTDGYTKPVWYLWSQDNVKVYRTPISGCILHMGEWFLCLQPNSAPCYIPLLPPIFLVRL